MEEHFKYKEMEEKWKDIYGYKGLYQISNLGRVKSLSRKIYNEGLDTKRNTFISKEKILKGSINSDGYVLVILPKKSIRKTFKIHRLVAKSFIPNIKNKPYVNHIDGNKENNKEYNLEWNTPKENSRHAYDMGLNTISKKCREASIAYNKTRVGELHSGAKIVLNTQTGIFYSTLKEAKETVSISYKYLSRMLSGEKSNLTYLIYV